MRSVAPDFGMEYDYRGTSACMPASLARTASVGDGDRLSGCTLGHCPGCSIFVGTPVAGLTMSLIELQGRIMYSLRCPRSSQAAVRSTFVQAWLQKTDQPIHHTKRVTSGVPCATQCPHIGKAAKWKASYHAQ